jgi:preprotein translocase subunit SecG
MHILLYFLLTLHVLVCLLMVLVVLMQRPRNEGLGAAFGSGMTDNIFGAQTTNVLAKFTTWLGGTFFVLTLALAMVYARIYNGNTTLEKELMAMPKPAAAAASPTPTPVGTPLPAEPSPTAAAPAVSSAATATPAPEASATPTPPNAAPNVPVEAPASNAN